MTRLNLTAETIPDRERQMVPGEEGLFWNRLNYY
jgi:hypothetical protein